MTARNQQLYLSHWMESKPVTAYFFKMNENEAAELILCDDVLDLEFSIFSRINQLNAQSKAELQQRLQHNDGDGLLLIIRWLKLHLQALRTNYLISDDDYETLIQLHRLAIIYMLIKNCIINKLKDIS